MYITHVKWKRFFFSKFPEFVSVFFFLDKPFSWSSRSPFYCVSLSVLFNFYSFDAIKSISSNLLFLLNINPTIEWTIITILSHFYFISFYFISFLFHSPRDEEWKKKEKRHNIKSEEILKRSWKKKRKETKTKKKKKIIN